MCGLAGFVNRGTESGYGIDTLSRISEILAHRGPDDLGFMFENGDGRILEATKAEYLHLSSSAGILLDTLISSPVRSGLMHRRLSIIKPGSQGHQPMWVLDGKVWLTFNGEIYNYKALRKELESAGLEFKTETDSEVLLQGYLYWGNSVVEHLDGMWSFVVLDLRKKILFASVDMAGIKPFYYKYDDTGFLFASEIKAFSQPARSFSVNWHKVNRFLALGLSDEDSGSTQEETMVSGVYRLKAGQQLVLSLSTLEITISSYYKRKVNPYFDFQTYKKEASQVSKIRELLIEMIGLRLQADVPLGICLSGGIDSSTLAGLMAFADSGRAQSTERKAFMATLPPGTPGDESAWARRMANHAGFDFIEIQPTTDDFVASLSDFVYTIDEPAPGPNAFSQYAVFQKVASSGIKVSIDGQGADELFGGYYRQQQVWSLEQLRMGKFAAPDLKFLGKAALNSVSASYRSAIQKWLKPGLNFLKPSVFEGLDWNENSALSLNAQLEKDFRSSTLPFLLKAADRNSMRWSVESRVPFADFEPLVSYMFQLEGSGKIQSAQTKYLLRKAAQGFVPQSILDRKDKIGFAAPNLLWIKALPDALVHDLIHSEEASWLNASLFWVRWQQLKAEKTWEWQTLWRILAVLFWQRRFIKGNSLS